MTFSDCTGCGHSSNGENRGKKKKKKPTKKIRKLFYYLFFVRSARFIHRALRDATTLLHIALYLVLFTVLFSYRYWKLNGIMDIGYVIFTRRYIVCATSLRTKMSTRKYPSFEPYNTEPHTVRETSLTLD